MPELPEVESVRKKLLENIKNKQINFVKLYVPKSLRNYPKSRLSNLEGQKIVDVKRKGKYLVVETKDFFIGLHLRMEGKFFIENEIDSKHTIIVFGLGSKYLHFKDHRKFATVDIFEKSKFKYEELKPIVDLGPEPWDTSFEYLKEKLQRRTAAIKSTLLDQKLMSGLGNIYVDEVLFRSKVSPLRPSNKVSDKEIKEILKYSRSVLKKSIELNGTTIRSYESLGNKGGFQRLLKVHTKEGEACPTGEVVKKIRVGGRGTYYCPKYQK